MRPWALGEPCTVEEPCAVEESCALRYREVCLRSGSHSRVIDFRTQV